MTPEMEEVKPGKWACPVHEDIVVYATREPKCDLCQQTMPDQTPDAAREANGFGGYSRADVEDACRAADLVLAHPLTRNVGGPYIVLSTKDAATLVSAARAAVSRARDAAWRRAVEAVRRENPACCAPEGMCETDAMSEGAHAALDALLARMDTKEPTDV